MTPPEKTPMHVFLSDPRSTRDGACLLCDVPAEAHKHAPGTAAGSRLVRLNAAYTALHMLLDDQDGELTEADAATLSRAYDAVGRLRLAL